MLERWKYCLRIGPIRMPLGSRIVDTNDLKITINKSDNQRFRTLEEYWQRN